MNLELVNDIQPLSFHSKIEDAQEVFKEFLVTHIPVVDNENYIGCLAAYDIDGMNSDVTIQSLGLDLEQFYGKEDMNEQEVMELMGRYDANMLPILSQNKGEYLGYLELNHLLAYFSDMPFMNEHGNIIVVAKGRVDHSFSEVCQIIESNNTKVLSGI